MPIEITIPRLGWSMEEGVFSGWLKKDGDPVKSGEPLFTLEGEKSAQDIESTDDGTLRIPKGAPEAGDTVKVGQVIGYLAGKNEVVELTTAPVKASPAENEIQSDGSHNGEQKADSAETPAHPPASKVGVAEPVVSPACSPRARRKAAELGVEVNRLQGTGNHGRVTEEDVIKAAADKKTSAAPGKPAKPMPANAGQTSTMRRNIAERTALSFSQIPHFYLRAEVDATKLVAMRQNLLGVLEKECDVRVTLTDFFLRAQATALQEFPAVNAVWQNNEVVRYRDSDVGVVVGLPDGLVIPIIRAAQNLSFVQLAKERARLVGLVRAGRFTAEMVAGGATSISNLGTGRTDEFAAIIPPHQSSILAVGRAAPRPFVLEGRVEVRTTLRFCLSVDHRVLDGGPAADFLGRIVELLENPELLADAN
jgi:pyruvate dehydrogenase E2 component (dihydrolipoamide acetyltransferase)